MNRQTDREIADQLLIEWYRWSEVWRPRLGAPRVSPYCKQSTSSRQYDETADIVSDRVHHNQMKTVDFCIDAIEVPMQQAIGTEMRNRVIARVWRDSGGRTFAMALDAIIPIMRKRGLFD